MSGSFQYDVFLSHNAKDKPRVRRLAERLKQAGLTVWLDEWNILSGDIIALKVDEGLERSRVLILCISPNALASNWVDLERSTAVHRDPANEGRRFIPLLLADSELPDTLRRYKWVDYREGSDAAFDELLAACRATGIKASPPDQNTKPGVTSPENPQRPASKKSTGPEAKSGMTKNRRARSTAWEKVAPYAALSFLSFLCGVGLLALMLWKAEVLVALGLVGNIYYIVLLPLALATSGFLFGVFRSYAHYKGQQIGGTLELGGPIVGFALVVLGGFYLPNPAPESFDVTVLVRGEKGRSDLVLRSSGTVWMTLGNDRRSEKIGDKGQAEFKNIPSKFRAEEVPIFVEADRVESTDDKYRLASGTVSVVVRRKAARVSGRVQDGEGRPVAGAVVRAGDVRTEVDADGHFRLSLPHDVRRGGLAGEVSAPGFEIWRGQFVPEGGAAVIMLERSD